MLMNDMLMWLLAEIFPGIMRSSLFGANALKLGAIIGTMSISFFGMRLWVFFQKRYAEEARSLTDCETIKLPLIKRVYEVDTVIVGAIKPVHAVDTMILCAPEKPKLNMLTIKTRFIEYAPTQTLEFLSDEDINHYSNL
jgi:hypothetical protein